MMWCDFLHQQEAENKPGSLLQSDIPEHLWAWKSNCCWLFWVFAHKHGRETFPDCSETLTGSLDKTSCPMPIWIVTASGRRSCYNATKDVSWLVSTALLSQPDGERSQACKSNSNFAWVLLCYHFEASDSIRLHFAIACPSGLGFSALV